MPHSSAQRTSKVSSFVGLTNTTLSTSGLASALTPSWYAQNEGITSSDVTCISTIWLTGSSRCGTSTPPYSGKRYVNSHCCAITCTCSFLPCGTTTGDGPPPEPAPSSSRRTVP